MCVNGTGKAQITTGKAQITGKHTLPSSHGFKKRFQLFIPAVPEKITPAVIYTVQIVMSGSGITAAAAATIGQIFTLFTFPVLLKNIAGRYLPEALIDRTIQAFFQ